MVYSLLWFVSGKLTLEERIVGIELLVSQLLRFVHLSSEEIVVINVTMRAEAVLIEIETRLGTSILCKLVLAVDCSCGDNLEIVVIFQSVYSAAFQVRLGSQADTGPHCRFLRVTFSGFSLGKKNPLFPLRNGRLCCCRRMNLLY